jgi:hypothetical protein
MTTRLTVPTKERRLLVILRMIQGICPIEMLPCRSTAADMSHSPFFHSNIDRAAKVLIE